MSWHDVLLCRHEHARERPARRRADAKSRALRGVRKVDVVAEERIERLLVEGLRAARLYASASERASWMPISSCDVSARGAP
jgi:hypothetical protein